MFVAVAAVYWPVPTSPQDNSLGGIDYEQLHSRRIRFAQASLEHGALPSWYPREICGSPFWSNTQNFPFTPTRLLVLTLDPVHVYAVSVQIAAALTALFTFLYCRRIGLGRVGAATAGWSFACCGYFADRVLAGYLPLLEAFCGLPLLLWLVEMCVTASPREDRRYAWKLGGLAVASLCIALAGHPQLPMYAFIVAGLYVLYRTRLRIRAAWPVVAAMVLGLGCAAFSLWPMFRLIGRSTRILPLDDAPTDVAFPVGRLTAFLLPWRDGWPQAVSAEGSGFAGYPNDAYFWDTVCYIGWLPLLAVLFLLARLVVTRQLPSVAGRFLAVAGVLALVTALPLIANLIDKAVPGTVVRSVSRQVYITELSLAVAMGVGIDVLLKTSATWRGGKHIAAIALLAALLIGHAVDLGHHDRSFVKMVSVSTERGLPFEQQIRQDVGSGRIAMDTVLGAPFNREIDDVGFFDSIMLASSYAALMDLCGRPPGYNVQVMDGSEMPIRALAATGTKLMLTTRARPDLQLLSDPAAPVHIYQIPDAAPRAAFFHADSVLYVSVADMHQRLRDPAHNMNRHVMVPPEDYGLPPTPATGADPAGTVVAYQRPSSDEIIVKVHAARPGFLRLLEAFDPGWAATVNGAAVDVVQADSTFLAVALPDGQYDVRFRYTTPGATTGIALSGASLLLIVTLLMWVKRQTSKPQTNVPRTSPA